MHGRQVAKRSGVRHKGDRPQGRDKALEDTIQQICAGVADILRLRYFLDAGRCMQALIFLCFAVMPTFAFSSRLQFARYDPYLCTPWRNLDETASSLLMLPTQADRRSRSWPVRSCRGVPAT